MVNFLESYFTDIVGKNANKGPKMSFGVVTVLRPIRVGDFLLPTKWISRPSDQSERIESVPMSLTDLKTIKGISPVQ